MPAGRPSKYKPEYCEVAKALCWQGAIDEELATYFEVSVSTLNLWKLEHPEFSEALKSGKDFADDRVERALYQKAVGYEQDEVKIFMPAGAEAPVYAPFRAKLPPDTTAAIFWLKNRRKEQWQDSSSREITGANGGAIQSHSKIEWEVVNPKA